jgi:hypothetical protein
LATCSCSPAPIACGIFCAAVPSLCPAKRTCARREAPV